MIFVYNIIKQKNRVHFAEGVTAEVGMSSFTTSQNQIVLNQLESTTNATNSISLGLCVNLIWFVSVYSGPSFLMDRQGIDLAGIVLQDCNLFHPV